MLRRRAMVGVLVLVAAACSGGGDDQLFGSSTTTAGTASTGAGSALVVGSEGGSLEGPDGITLDVFAATFPADTEIAIGAAGAPSLPEGATTVGTAFSVSSATAPQVPVILEVPIPAGADRDHLFLLRTADDGTQQFLAGAIEGDSYVVATPGFSIFTLVAYDPAAALLVADAEPGFIEGIPVPEELYRAGLRDELAEIANGLRDTPAARTVLLVGPDELGIGEVGTFAAIDFLSLTPQFNRHTWTTYGPLQLVDGATAPSAVFEGTAEGRAMVTIEITDPRLGVTAFASMRVFVGDAETPGLNLVPDQPFYYSGTDATGATVDALPLGMVPPFEFEWVAAPGESDLVQGAPSAIPIALPALTRDTILTVTVRDAQGTTVTRRVGLVVVPRNCYLLALAGPARVPYGEATEFEILTAAGVATDGITVEGFAPFTSAISGTTLVATFHEPRAQVIRLTGQLTDAGRALHPGCTEAAGFHGLRVTGLPLSLTATLFEPVAIGPVGERIQFFLDIQGGLLVSSDLDDTGNPLPPTYELIAKWGDGKEREESVQSFYASVPVRFRIGHIYDEPGEYAISFVVRSADGQEVIVDHQLLVNPGEPVSWNSGVACPSGEGGSGYDYTWSVKLTPPSDASEEDWDVDIYFHDCPDGGRVHFSGFGAPIGISLIATVELVETRGALGASADAQYSGVQEFHLQIGLPPAPNIDEELGTH